MARRLAVSQSLPLIRLTLDALEPVLHAQVINPLVPAPRVNAHRRLVLSTSAAKIAVPLTIRAAILDNREWALIRRSKVGALLNSVDGVVGAELVVRLVADCC